jgi:hypothetical protein
VPGEGLVDVHRYLTIAVEGRRVQLDASLPSPPWDGRSSLAPVCGPGRDFPASADPDAEMRALEHECCDAQARAPFIAVLAAAGDPRT